MPTPRKPRPRSFDNDDFGQQINSQQINIERNTSMSRSPIKLVISGIVLIVALVITLMTFKIVTINGNELGIKETWSGGVQNEILQPKTYFLFPGWSQTVYEYDASSQVFVMNDKGNHTEGIKGRQQPDSYLVQSQEGQDMKISLNLRWRIDPAKLVSIHKTVRMQIEEKIIRPVVMRVVKDKATEMKAIEAYSGEGLVRLQASIQNALSGGDQIEGKELRERGVIVENFVIEHIALDPAYVSEIVKKQIAVQQQLRAVEEQKAAEAEALVAKSKAQADYNTQEVQAKRDAIVKVTAAQAAMEQQVLSAKGEQQKLIIESEGKQKSMEAIAIGTLAQGKAEAAAKELMLKAYAVQGADAWVKVEVAKSLAQGISNIKGYLPGDMKVNLLTDNYLKGVDTLTGAPVVAPAAAK